MYQSYRCCLYLTILGTIWNRFIFSIWIPFLLISLVILSGRFQGFLFNDCVNEDRRWRTIQFLLATCHDMPASIAASVLLGTERGRAIQFREKSMPGIRQPRDMAEAAKCLNARKPSLNAADCSRREMRGCTMDDDM